ncbi:MAG: transcription termination/antitermination protein NusG [Candidatus Babeliales bacterium]
MKRWYVIQVFAGYEEHVKADLVKQIDQEGLEEAFGEVLIPSAKLKQYFSSLEATDQQLFPGYMLIEMELSPRAIRLVTTSPRVMRFLGGKDPVPLSAAEVERIMAKVRGDVVVAPQREEFLVEQEIEISEGPFAGFSGIVEKIDKDAERLTVMVSIFGRMTPVELGFNQVKRS